MIRIGVPDVPAADRLVEALYVAAGQRPGTAQADEWLAIAADLESGIDELPPQEALPERHLHALTEGAA